MFLANKLNKGGGAGGYQISRSLRFNSADSAYLNRTPASASNQKTWTWSGWIKRGKLDVTQYTIFTATGGQGIRVNDDAPGNQIRVRVASLSLIFTPVLRDPSAWYHIVVSVDTTQATSSDRVKLYINNQLASLSSGTYPSQNADTGVNAAVAHFVGAEPTPSQYYDGLMTELNFIDGQALTPSSFGETNAQTGVWQPKAYSGSYGTNGFYLNFSDNSNTTAATLGKDYSGNGNNWTPNNFSVTAGAGNDSLVDSPTSYGTDTGVGGTVRGNYATLNPLTTTAGTYTQGNLRYVSTSTDRRSNATISVATGKWYWEVTLGNAPYSPRSGGSQWNAFGFGLSTVFNSTTSASAVTDALILEDSGYYKNFSGAQTDGGTAFSSGDVLSIAVDLDGNTFTFRRNNTSLVTGTIGGTAGRELVPIIISYDGQYGVMDCNFGQRAFAYTAPSGFKALCTQNLPTPTIGATTATQAGKYFNPVLYTGSGYPSSPQTITGVGFQPDWTWVKRRSVATDHCLVDAVRGAGKALFSNSTSAEDATAGYYVTAFTSDGFSVDLGSETNTVGNAYVAWNWKANGAGSTNTAGSITSTVSANTTSGFSVVTYTGTGANATVGHGLGVAPSMLIIKKRSASGADGAWIVGHVGIVMGTGRLILNDTDSNSNAGASVLWNSTAASSTVFSLGDYTAVNNSGSTFVAYCFAEVAGYSKFGSYTGNGSADGPFVFTGMRPAYVMIKRTDSTANWYVLDVARNTYNAANLNLYPNLSSAEATFSALDILSNGFKIRNSDVDFNASSGTYIYACFASNPFKYSLAR